MHDTVKDAIRLLVRPSVLWLLLLDCSLLAPGSMAQLRATAQTGYISFSAIDRESFPDNRYALLVGISDYPGTENDLGGGPLNDVALMKDLLMEKLGFREENILTLTDLQATAGNVVSAFFDHLGRAGRDGAVVFYYSGHGSQITNLDDDVEADGLDEVLVLRSSEPDKISLLLDDDLGTLVSSLNAHNVLVLLDNCYSGTGTRGASHLLHWSDLAGDVVPPITLKSDTLTLGRPYVPKRITRTSLDLLARDKALRLPRNKAASEPSNHILLSASAENEQSLNVSFVTKDGSRVAVGLFTAALYTELNRADLRTTSFTTLLSSLQEDAQRAVARMRAGRQTPQAEGTQQGTPIAAYLLSQ